MTTHNHNRNDPDIRVSSCQRQGSRPYQEDTFYIGERSITTTTNGDGFSIGIFDGHGGSSVSIRARDTFAPENPITDTCIRMTFQRVAEDTQTHESGSTGVVVGIDLVAGIANVGNLGDSPCLVIRDDGSVERVTIDHVPTNERARIQSGGDAVIQGRIDKGYQSIAISRAFGDAQFSTVISDPSFCTVSLGDVICIVICSDGVTDGATDQRIRDIVLEAPRDTVATLLVETAMRGKGWKGDNTTAIVVWIDPTSHLDRIVPAPVTTLIVVDKNGQVIPTESWPGIAGILIQHQGLDVKDWRIVVEDGVMVDAEYEDVNFRKSSLHRDSRSSVYGEILMALLPEHLNDADIIRHALGMIWDEPLTPISLIPADPLEFDISLARAVEYGVISESMHRQVRDWLSDYE